MSGSCTAAAAMSTSMRLTPQRMRLLDVPVAVTPTAVVVGVPVAGVVLWNPATRMPPHRMLTTMVTDAAM